MQSAPHLFEYIRKIGVINGLDQARNANFFSRYHGNEKEFRKLTYEELLQRIQESIPIDDDIITTGKALLGNFKPQFKNKKRSNNEQRVGDSGKRVKVPNIPTSNSNASGTEQKQPCPYCYIKRKRIYNNHSANECRLKQEFEREAANAKDQPTQQSSEQHARHTVALAGGVIAEVLPGTEVPILDVESALGDMGI